MRTARRNANDDCVEAGILRNELNISQEGVPGTIPAEACYLDWQESLTLLAELVETEIPDQL